MTYSRNTGCFKKDFTTLKAYTIYPEDMYSVLNCHNVARHTEFYLGLLRFNVTSTANAGCFRKSFTMVLQTLLCGECYQNVYILTIAEGVERRTVRTPSRVNVFVTLATKHHFEYDCKAFFETLCIVRYCRRTVHCHCCRRYQILPEVVGLERGPLGLVSTTDELL
jgi:hypothetical protein